MATKRRAGMWKKKKRATKRRRSKKGKSSAYNGTFGCKIVALVDMTYLTAVNNGTIVVSWGASNTAFGAISPHSS